MFSLKRELVDNRTLKLNLDNLRINYKLNLVSKNMTNKIQRILVPLDGSENSLRGLENAITIAKPVGAAITGLHIIHIPARSAIQFTPQQRKKEISFAESLIEKAIGTATKNGVNFKPRIETGNPAEKIVQIAKDGNYDLVVIGSRGRGAKKEMFLGSVSNQVLHKTGA
ncbi:MAG: universal stress protein, partial [Candidatus Nitrosotenuis sp.]